MATSTRTWWGRRFIEAIERFTDPGRLGRGRAYANNGRVLDWAIQPGRVVATVRGSVNPYFGVYKEPRYTITITIPAIAEAQWAAIIASIGTRASLVIRLLLGEMPDDIEKPFNEVGVHLLPHQSVPFKTACSCPDYANPCKHVAGVYYVLAKQLDHDPFLMFALRGLSKEALQKALGKTSLGKALVAELSAPAPVPIAAVTLYPLITTEALPRSVSPREFWQGAERLGPDEPFAAPAVPALTIKREGDFPAFWPRENSFIEVMEEFYGRVRKKVE